MVYTGGVAGFLEAHVEIEQIDENLHVPLRLKVAAHHAEAHHRLAVFGDEGGNDCVERSFAGGVGVWVAGFEIEQLAAVLQAEAELWRTQARSEAAEVALDERDHVVVFVGRSEINRIARCARRGCQGWTFVGVQGRSALDVCHRTPR